VITILLYAGGLSPNLTYGKSYSTLKLNNLMYLINTFILSMIVGGVVLEE
jgi:hypothetical protein